MKYLPWILLLLSLVALFWVIYIHPVDNTERIKWEKDLAVSRDSTEMFRAKLEEKASQYDSAAIKAFELFQVAEKEKVAHSGTMRKLKAREKELENRTVVSDPDIKALLATKDTIIHTLEQRVDSLGARIQQAGINTEDLHNRATSERYMADKVSQQLLHRAEYAEARVTVVQEENDKLTREKKRVPLIVGGAAVLGFLLGVLAN